MKRYRLQRVGDLTPDEERMGEELFAAEERDRRTRYETHTWNPTEDDSECIVCGVTWGDCDDTCPGIDRQMVLADVSDDLIRVRVIGEAGREGEVHVNSRYDRATTARLLRQIADDYAAGAR